VTAVCVRSCREHDWLTWLVFTCCLHFFVVELQVVLKLQLLKKRNEQKRQCIINIVRTAVENQCWHRLWLSLSIESNRSHTTRSKFFHRRINRDLQTSTAQCDGYNVV
jgi:hypothetical protein